MHQVGTAQRAGMHLDQSLFHGGHFGLVQSQLGLTHQTGQRRAQLVGGVVDKAFLLAEAAAHGVQQLVDGQRQRMHLVRGLGQFNGWQG